MRSMMEILGAAVCRWKGRHKWQRRQKYDKAITPTGAELGYMQNGYHSVCARCGLTRAIVARKRKVTP